MVENQCLFSSSCRHLSNCTLLGQHPSAELFSDQNKAFVAKQLSHSFSMCPTQYLIIYMYVHEFSIYFTYFTNSLFFFKSYLHSYTLTHVSHQVSPTLIINVCSLRQCGKTTAYVHLKCSFLLHSKHKYIKPLAYLILATICTFKNTKIIKTRYVVAKSVL